MTLYPYQETGAAWLAERPRALLADDPGLGKTATAIVAARRVGARRVTVVCPTCVLWNWKREVETWAPDWTVQVADTGAARIGPANVIVTTHGLLLSEKLRAQLVTRGADVLVLDESHFFRSPDAKRTHRFYGAGSRGGPGVTGLVDTARRTWLLSATPMPNDASELWTMAHGAFGFPETFEAFRAHFCKLGWSPYGDNVKVLGNQNVEELRERLRPFVLKRRKADVLRDLPAVRFETIPLPCTISPAEIDRVVAELDPKLVEALRTADGAEAAFAELGASKAFSAFRRLCGLAKADAVADLLATELDSGLDKVVVMAHHTDVVEAIRAKLADYGAEAITGATPAAERVRIVDRFQCTRDARVVVGNIVAAGTGITLTAASELVFAEMSYVPGENVQAADRIHRIGQRNGCRVRFASLAGTLDESLVGVLRRKSDMIREVMQG